jgi:hypothetical protein
MPRLVAAAKFPDGTTQSSAANVAQGTVFSNDDPSVVVAAQRAASIANAMYFVPILVPVATTLTGLRYRKGTGVTAANAIGALYNAAGTRVAVSGTVAAGTVASVAVTLPFSGTYAAAAGLYWAGWLGSSTSADFYGWTANEYLGPASTATQGSFTAPASFTPAALTSLTAIAAIPLLATY